MVCYKMSFLIFPSTKQIRPPQANSVFVTRASSAPEKRSSESFCTKKFTHTSSMIIPPGMLLHPQVELTDNVADKELEKFLELLGFLRI